MNGTGTLLSRRRLLQGTALAGGSLVIAACTPGGGSVATPRPATPAPTGAPSPQPTVAPSVVSPNPTADQQATVLVRDVIEYQLRGPYKWNGGSVTLRLHEGLIGGEPIYYVRTDASDKAFAEAEGLVWVPVLSLALKKDGGTGRLYLFEGGAAGQKPVFSTGPGHDDFTPLYRIVRARFSGAPSLLDDAAAVEAAKASGALALEETEIVVNYQAVKWPGGELPVDPAVEKPLDGGPLLGAPDLASMTVTFKLHQCFPESRYIVTDTSAVPMAPMMNIQGSPGTEGLAEARRRQHDHGVRQRAQRSGCHGLPAWHLPGEGR